jgi:site-specific recombinase XerD
MHMLHSGTDITGIALWLGHESPETTHIYVEADRASVPFAVTTRGYPVLGIRFQTP